MIYVRNGIAFYKLSDLRDWGHCVWPSIDVFRHTHEPDFDEWATTIEFLFWGLDFSVPTSLLDYDESNHILSIAKSLFVCWCKRGGYALCLDPFCGVEFVKNDFIHVRGWYLQIGNYGGYIAWKSQKCYGVE